jgi:hypothetical protein
VRASKRAVKEKAASMAIWDNITNVTDNVVRSGQAATANLRQSIGRSVGSVTGNENQVLEALPYLASGAVGIGAILLNEPLGKAGKWVFSKLKWVVTGGGTEEKEGFLEKIPVVGYLFKGAGWVLDKLGDWSGYILGGLAALFTFKVFQNRGREPDSNIDTGTSRVGTVTPVIPLTTPAGTTINAPAGIPPGPPAPSVPAGVNADDIEGLTRTAEEALRRGDQAMLTAINAVRGRNNEVFENRVFAGYSFLRFNGLDVGQTLSTGSNGQQAQMEEVERRLNAAGTPIVMGARRQVIEQLMETRLTAVEAASMVPEAPRLTLTPIRDVSVTADVAAFAVAFQNTYGNDGGLPNTAAPELRNGGGIAFARMNLSQKREFLRHAIAYSARRYREIWNCCGKRGTPDHDSGFPHQNWVTQNCRHIEIGMDSNTLQWGDETTPSIWSSNVIARARSFTHANGRVTRLGPEMDFLMRQNGDTGWTDHGFRDGDQNPDNMGSRYTSLSGCTIGSGFATLNRAIEDFANQVDAQQVTLQRECTGINNSATIYQNQIRISQARLKILREHKIALVSHLEEQARNADGMHVITAVDLRFAPAAGTRAPRIQLTGNFESNGADRPNKFIVRQIGTTMLDTNIEIDMENPEAGMNALKARIDQIRAGAGRGVSSNHVSTTAPAFTQVSMNDVQSQRHLPEVVAPANGRPLA